MLTRTRRHVARHVVGYIALIIAVAGVPMAIALGRNSVGPLQIKPNAVRSSELKNEAVKGVDVNESTLGQVPAAENADLLDDLDSSDFLRGNASAGGDLGGNYPAPSIANEAVTEGKIANGAVTPDKLGTIPAVRATDPTGPSDSGIPGDCGAAALVPTGMERPVQFTSEAFDTAGMHPTGGCTPALARLTAPRSGIYEVSGGALWSSLSLGLRQISLRKNGNGYLAAQATPAQDLANLQEVSTLVQLAPGDYVELLAYQNSGSPLGVLAEPRSYVAMAWVGPG